MVILNQLTAIKWVSQELLKSFFKESGIFSLAQMRIHQRNIASSEGYNSWIAFKNEFLI